MHNTSGMFATFACSLHLCEAYLAGSLYRTSSRCSVLAWITGAKPNVSVSTKKMSFFAKSFRWEMCFIICRSNSQNPTKEGRCGGGGRRRAVPALDAQRRCWPALCGSCCRWAGSCRVGRAQRAPASCCVADVSGERSQNVPVVLQHAAVQSLSKTYAGNCYIENLLETTRAEDRTGNVKEGDDSWAIWADFTAGDSGRARGLVSTDLILRARNAYIEQSGGESV